MNNNSSSSSQFTTTHFMITFVATALIFMSIIYWVSGCQSKDYSMNPAAPSQKEASQGGSHH